jgi:predicted nucleic acid-binding Zn ribbon protein
MAKGKKRKINFSQILIAVIAVLVILTMILSAVTR